ncbi:MAG: MBL fold metallo-hydrolase [Rhodospirillales bacterium]|nr:MBL fold metallo-hydrolase [Alphaproteobacteria bacterium]USO06200.1 MAG: MBL fold metallo-hydrolase [Rhodospirillales bacterium]HOO49949.1 MBL fold metallo-hydrolase [Alphaproteobacteria bacterium]
MSEKLTLTILGCGNSSGVPAIGNYWGDCDPNEPKNVRSRSSLAVQSAETTLIIDTGPDFRTQINREDIRQIDAVLYTHSHSDHTDGINDLRIIRFRNKQRVPVYGNKEALSDLSWRFAYMFDGGKIDLYPPMLEPHEFTQNHFGQLQTVGDINFIPFIQDHGSIQSVGYRFGDIAYSLDMHDLDEQAIETLCGIKTWIVDAAAYNQDQNAVHANLKTIYRLNEQIGASEVILSSLSLHMDYQTLLKELPVSYKPAYDGLKISV